jgi:cysteine desulfurase/selenocysteine lyase
MTAVAKITPRPAPFDVATARRDFPILSRLVHGKPLTFLDSAASAQKPRAVIDAMTRAFETEYANVHRGAYFLSERATVNYEGPRLHQRQERGRDRLHQGRHRGDQSRRSELRPTSAGARR